jgi:Mg2+ and Co2+ transporter CorA
MDTLWGRAMLDQVAADTVTATSDPDFPGLSFAYRFRDGQAERLAGRDIAAALTQPGGWTWLHLGLNEPSARDWIAHTAPLPERAREILLSDDEHQILEPIEGGVAGVFADLLRAFGGNPPELGRLHFALTDTLVVSGRRAALGAIQRTLDALGRGKKLPNAMALLEEIVSHFADAVDAVAEELSDTLDAIEESLIGDAPADDRARLGPARRTAVRIHRQLSTLRLLFRRWSAPADETQTGIAAAAVRLAQRLDGLDQEVVAIQERARLLQDEIAAKVAADTNRSLFVLTIVTAFLLPPTLVAGIFGMNVTDLPFTKGESGFLWAMAITVVSSALVYVFMRWLRIIR